jgi:hypothetical protein
MQKTAQSVEKLIGFGTGDMMEILITAHGNCFLKSIDTNKIDSRLKYLTYMKVFKWAWQKHNLEYRKYGHTHFKTIFVAVCASLAEKVSKAV